MSFTSYLGIQFSMPGNIVLGHAELTGLVALGHLVPIGRFRPMPEGSSLAPGSIFFSPGLTHGPGAEMHVASVLIDSRPSDQYRIPQSQQERAVRPLILGPAPLSPSGRAWPPDFSISYEPVLNSAQYGLMNNKPGGSAIRGVLTDTGTMESQIVLV